MISWYNDVAKKRMTRSFIVFWMIFLIVTSKYFDFLFLNIYLPIIYPLMMIIFLSLQLNHPHVSYIFELRKKYAIILFKEMLWITYHMMMYVLLIMIGHVIIMVRYQLSFSLTSFMMINASTLLIHGIVHPLLTPFFYKILSFILIFLSHHFLLDASFYEAIHFLYIEPSNNIQIIIFVIAFILLQLIHFLSIVKKVF